MSRIYTDERYAAKFPHIDPVTKLYRDLDTRFWSRVDAEGDCWEWVGPLVAAGYGYFRLTPVPGSGAGVRAHRYGWEYLVGPIEEGFTLDHLCRNRRCVNPDHLEPATRGDNVLRGYSPNVRTYRSNRITCKHGHVWDSATTALDRKGRRYCRRCHAEGAARRRKAQGRR